MHEMSRLDSSSILYHTTRKRRRLTKVHEWDLKTGDGSGGISRQGGKRKEEGLG